MMPNAVLAPQTGVQRDTRGGASALVVGADNKVEKRAVQVAEVHGTIEGNLTVRQRLVIHATGRVTGKIRYGKVVIEEGGQLSGDIECSVNAGSKVGSKHAMALAA